MDHLDYKSLLPEELAERVAAMGEKPFRAKQLFAWMHKKQAVSYDEMTNLPGAFRDRLKEEPLTVLECVRTQVSAIDGTRKYLFRLPDGHVVERVWMRYHHGNSVCISTQVGCRMGCAFCASTLDGWLRNLTPSEMLEQVYRIQRLTGERVSHVVLMGTGEPMDNYSHVVRFIRLVSHSQGNDISQRNITVSTCGLVPKIRQFADEGLVVTLALSLHAPNDEKRRGLMPVARRYTIRETVDACRYYYERTGRRLTFEYSLVAGENDSGDDAAELAGVLKGLNCHVNLIPVNPIKERTFRPSGQKNILRFKNKLEKCGINVTIRREMGRDIDGACGQLRKSYMEKEGVTDRR